MRIRNRVIQLEKNLINKEPERPDKINMDDPDQVADHLQKLLDLGYERGFFKSYDQFKDMDEYEIDEEINRMIENDPDEFVNLLLRLKSWLIENRMRWFHGRAVSAHKLRW